MKAMGLRDLVLVRPKHFPSPEASARARGAVEILDRAQVVGSLAEAIGDCGFVIGASARLRGVALPTANPRACAEAVWRCLPANRVAIVFGPEQSGLTNDDLGRCHQLVHIPTDAALTSLNLAMAVQVMCYELRMAASQARSEVEAPQAPSEVEAPQRDAPLATAQQLESFYAHLEQVLESAGFLRPGHQKQLRLKLRRVFYRATLDYNEVNILRGVLAALEPPEPRTGERRNTTAPRRVERTAE
jgi:TrmH family RNA methyltransferase